MCVHSHGSLARRVMFHVVFIYILYIYKDYLNFHLAMAMAQASKLEGV